MLVVPSGQKKGGKQTLQKSKRQEHVLLSYSPFRIISDQEVTQLGLENATFLHRRLNKGNIATKLDSRV